MYNGHRNRSCVVAGLLFLAMMISPRAASAQADWPQFELVRRPPLRYVPFDSVDHFTRRRVNLDTTIVVRFSSGREQRMSYRQFLSQANRTEQELNRVGMTLRGSSVDRSVGGARVDLDRYRRDRAAFDSPNLPPIAMPTPDLVSARINSLGRRAASPLTTLRQLDPSMATALASPISGERIYAVTNGRIVNAPATLLRTKVQRGDWLIGGRTFTGRCAFGNWSYEKSLGYSVIEGNFEVAMDMQSCPTLATLRYETNGTVAINVDLPGSNNINESLEILSIWADFQAPSTGPGTADVHFRVVGNELMTPISSQPGSYPYHVTKDWERAQTFWEDTYRLSVPGFSWLGGLDLTIGVNGYLGLSLDAMLESRAVTAQVTPAAGAYLYGSASAAVGNGWAGAEAGFYGEATLLEASVFATGENIVRSLGTGPNPIAAFRRAEATAYLTMLDGRIYPYVEVSYPCPTWSNWSKSCTKKKKFDWMNEDWEGVVLANKTLFSAVNSVILMP